jgi:5-(carboxyamino)imidazole ribonucleotide mutase
MKVSFLSGSTSDEAIVQQLIACINDSCTVDSAVISAHRHPDRLRAYLETTYFDYAIGAAGLAAHLPGAIASHQVKLTIGLPISNQLGGLDALLAILQMPFGIPVLTSGVDKVEAIAYFLKALSRHRPEGLGLVVSEETKNSASWLREISRFQDLASQWAISFRVLAHPDPLLLNLVAVGSSQDLSLVKYEESSALVCVPLLDKDRAGAAETAHTLLEWTSKGGLWLGINNLRNGLLAYIQALNTDHLWDQQLWTIRRR